MEPSWVGGPVTGPVTQRLSLAGRNALVTGGSRGIGKALATGLAEAGANVAVVSRSTKDEGEAVATHLRSLGVNSYAALADVTDRAAIGQAAEAVAREWGHLDIVIANAGIGIDVNAEDMTEAEWDRLMDVNLKGVFFTAQAAASVMIPRRSGNIIAVTSTSAWMVNGNPQAAYNTSKAGVLMLVKCLAYEWARYNIRVNAIAPGWMYTDMLGPYLAEHADEAYGYMARPAAMNRIARPDELAGAAVYLASDASSFTTGQQIVVDGGQTLTALGNQLIDE
jgi:NAD(P)-dependent dehydrogenase (short-subunit alcohol dehydrogenase family)